MLLQHHHEGPKTYEPATVQDLLLAVLVQSDDIKLAPNHAEMPSLLARMKPSALAKHVQKQKVGTKHQRRARADALSLVLSP